MNVDAIRRAVRSTAYEAICRRFPRGPERDLWLRWLYECERGHGQWSERKLLGMERLSPDGVVEEFLARWGNSDLRDKMPEPKLVANGSVVELNLIAVYGEHQAKGYATRALEMLTALCDENGVTIHLVARRLDDGPLSIFAPGCPATRTDEQLVAWYTRHGFVDLTFPGDDTRAMERKPRAQSSLALSHGFDREV